MDDSNNKQPQRGRNFQYIEDIAICHAWVITSEDATCSTNMKSNAFKEKFQKNYVKVIENCNSDFNKDYGRRNSTGCLNRFVKISKGLSKYLETEIFVGAPPSGDTGKEKWNEEEVSDLFVKRYPEYKRLVESIPTCKLVIGGKPKWRAFQDEEESDKTQSSKMTTRPEGLKNAEEQNTDTECEEKYKNVDGTAQEKRMQDHLQKKEQFMVVVSTAIKDGFHLLNNNMKRQNEIMLIDICYHQIRKNIWQKSYWNNNYKYN